MTRELQRRYLPVPLARQTITRRAEGDSATPRVIAGYSAVFYDPAKPDTEIALWDRVYERIMPGAFDRALREAHDVRCLFNHDPNFVLGRTAAKTCRLSVDAVGLKYEADENPADPTAAGVCAKLERGDVSGSSFAFVATKTVWIDDDVNDVSIREIHDLDLVDVGPVTFPWYEATTSGIARAHSPAERAQLEAIAAEAAARRAAKRGPSPADLRARVDVDYRLAQLRRHS